MSEFLPNEFGTVIPTEYKGITFRSRLEARWALFFDGAGFEWEYEPEGFSSPDGSTKYLPDFYIPNAGPCEGGPAFFEVKPKIGDEDEPTHEAIAKARLAALASGTRVIIAVGSPKLSAFPGEEWVRISTPFWEISPTFPDRLSRLWIGIDFGMPHFLHDDPHNFYYDGLDNSTCTDHNYWDIDLLQAAVGARSHRFWDPAR